MDRDLEGSKIMPCSVCQKVFNRSEDLTYHLLTHSLLELARALTILQIRLVQIEHNVEFDKIDAIKQELSTADEDENIDIEDEHIDIEDETEDVQHAPVIKERKNKADFCISGSRAPHTCSICRSVLSSRGALTKHMVTHNEKKPFQCEECEKSFNQARDLKTHTMQKHSGQRPHVCGICGKGFVHKFYLLEHMTYHTGERQFQCFHCGKRFKAQSALNKHIKRHTNTKDFTCNICSKAFAVKIDMRSHIKLVHEKPSCNKGIPAEPIKTLSYELNYQTTEVNHKEEDVDIQTDHTCNETIFKEVNNEEFIEKHKVAEKQVIGKGDYKNGVLESSQLDEWRLEQGAKLGRNDDSIINVVGDPSSASSNSEQITVDDQIPSLDSSMVSRPYIPNVPKV